MLTNPYEPPKHASQNRGGNHRDLHGTRDVKTRARRKKLRRLQFSLRTWLIFSTVAAIVIGFFGPPMWEEVKRMTSANPGTRELSERENNAIIRQILEARPAVPCTAPIPE